MISGHSYGPCVATLCDDSHDLAQGKCRPLQKAFFNVPSKTIVMKPGETKALEVKTLKPVSQGLLLVSATDSSVSVENNGAVSFENQAAKTIQVTAGDVAEETAVNLSLENVSGKIDVRPGSILTVKIIPQGLPKLTAMALDKASPSTSDQSVNLNLSFSKSFSQSASTKLNLKVSGDKSVLADATLKTITAVVGKGQKSARV